MSPPHPQLAADPSIPAAWIPRVPLRGTESFVDTMSLVWRHPSLTAIEVLWRWAVGIPLLLVLRTQALHILATAPVDTAALEASLESMTVFKPLAAFNTVHTTALVLWPAILPVARWLVPLTLLAWTAASTLGRTALLRRLDPTLHPRLGILLILRALRTLALLLLFALWWAGTRWATVHAITGPATRGGEPDLVSFCALVICGTLALFVGWAALNWVLDAAPPLAMRALPGGRGPLTALRAPLHLGSVRGKLVETNMVMSIVKIALLVLAMVFSACPLPFEAVATPQFLTAWCTGVVILYFLASDYFHAVRAAAYLALFRNRAVQL